MEKPEIVWVVHYQFKIYLINLIYKEYKVIGKLVITINNQRININQSVAEESKLIIKTKKIDFKRLLMIWLIIINNKINLKLNCLRFNNNHNYTNNNYIINNKTKNINNINNLKCFNNNPNNNKNIIKKDENIIKNNIMNKIVILVVMIQIEIIYNY